MLQKLRLCAALYFLHILSIQAQGITERNSENPFALVNLERHQFKFNLLSPGFNCFNQFRFWSGNLSRRICLGIGNE